MEGHTTFVLFEVMRPLQRLPDVAVQDLQKFSAAEEELHDGFQGFSQQHELDDGSGCLNSGDFHVIEA